MSVFVKTVQNRKNKVCQCARKFVIIISSDFDDVGNKFY